MITRFYRMGVLVCLSIFLWSHPVCADVTVEDFRMQVKVNSSQLKVGEKLQITCTFDNISDRRVTLPFGSRLVKIMFQTAVGGRLPSVARRGASSHYMGIDRIELDPGETHEYQLSGDIVRATRKVYLKKGQDSEEVEGIFIDLPTQDPVYVGAGNLNMHAEYDLYDAIDWSRPIDLLGVPPKKTNPNMSVNNVQEVSAGLTVSSGIVVKDPIMLKSEVLYIKIAD